MAALYNTVIYTPLFNALIFLYETISFGDLGVAIIILTLVIRIALIPIFAKMARQNLIIQRMQPEIKKIQEQHKHDKVKQGAAMMELYRKHNINPFSSFLFLLIQIPILIALFRVTLNGLKPEALDNLYSFIPSPGEINSMFLGLINLSNRNIVIAGLAAAAQYVQGRLAAPKIQEGKTTAAERIGRQMIFISPAITVIFLLNLPSAIGLYWLVSTAFSVFQQMYINKEIERHGDTRKVYQKSDQSHGVWRSQD